MEDARQGTLPPDDHHEANWESRERPTLAVTLGSTAVLLAGSALAMVLAFGEKVPCRAGAWNNGVQQYQDFCYTDIYPLYYGEGLSAGKVPYIGHPVEYPVLIGGAMQAAAWLVRNVDWVIRGREFFDVTVVLLGLGVATKFYPLVILGALFLLCLRAGRLKDFAKTFAAAAVAWLAVNLPVIIAAPSGWATFYVFSQDRGADWGSIWYLFEFYNVPKLGNYQLSVLNEMSAAALIIAYAAIALLALAAPRRPRLPQLCFLMLAAFLMTNKVWSPQYVIWLVPLAVLARPRWWPYALWQLAEVGYFLAIWAYLIFVSVTPGHSVTGYQGLSPGWYFAALVARFLTVALLAAYVVRDILFTERDVVRARGLDDPAGGVLDDAPDRFRIRLTSPFRRAGAASAS